MRRQSAGAVHHAARKRDPNPHRRYACARRPSFSSFGLCRRQWWRLQHRRLQRRRLQRCLPGVSFRGEEVLGVDSLALSLSFSFSLSLTHTHILPVRRTLCPHHPCSRTARRSVCSVLRRLTTDPPARTLRSQEEEEGSAASGHHAAVHAAVLPTLELPSVCEKLGPLGDTPGCGALQGVCVVLWHRALRASIPTSLR